jgi:hypothetical protein
MSRGVLTGSFGSKGTRHRSGEPAKLRRKPKKSGAPLLVSSALRSQLRSAAQAAASDASGAQDGEDAVDHALARHALVGEDEVAGALVGHLAGGQGALDLRMPDWVRKLGRVSTGPMTGEAAGSGAAGLLSQ